MAGGFRINPGLSAVLSFLWNGLGQLYNGEIKKGLTIMSVSAASMLVVVIGAVMVGQFLLMQTMSVPQLVWGLILLVLGIVSIAVVGIYNIYDAYNTALKQMMDNR